MTVDGDLFAREQAVLQQAQHELERASDAAGDEIAGLATLVDEYGRLLRTSRRLMRLSDRNERELAAMAERQKQAAREIAAKNTALEALSTKLAKYLAPQVYSSIFEGRQSVRLGSQRKKLTVFFSDIAGFTELTDKLESEDITHLLNHYLSEMTSIALAYGATVDKYIGDAIMIFFGDPESRGIKEDAVACVRMAIAMQQRIRDLAALWRDAGLEQPVTCRMGIHTGYCTVGNFGSEERMDYTIIGGGVNLASRLEEAAEPGTILISYETQALVKGEIQCEEVGPLRVRGLAYPVATYRTVDVASFDRAGDGALHTERNGFRLDLDPARLDAAAKAHALEALSRAMRLLAGPEQP